MKPRCSRFPQSNEVTMKQDGIPLQAWKYESTKFTISVHCRKNRQKKEQSAKYRSDAIASGERSPRRGREAPSVTRDAIFLGALKDTPASDFRFFQELTKPAGLRRRGPSPHSGSSPSFGYAATLASCPDSSKAGSLQVVSTFSYALRAPLNSKAFLPTIDINQYGWSCVRVCCIRSKECASRKVVFCGDLQMRSTSCTKGVKYRENGMGLEARP